MKGRVLITGGMGYVGGRVANYLVAQGKADIVVGSRRLRPPPAWLHHARVVKMDWESQDSLLAACHEVDSVLHLAGTNQEECARDPLGAIVVNAVNTVRLVEAAKVEGATRFIYLSTAQVYGTPLIGRIDEMTLPRPRHPYASSHRAGEDAVLAAHDAGHLIGLVLRLSNGFGLPLDPDLTCWTLLVNDLCRQAARTQRLELRSSGLQRRNFVTLHDVARVIEHLLELPREGVGGGIFNVGGTSAMRVVDMARAIQDRCSVILGFTPDIVRPEPVPADLTSELDFRIDKLIATGFVLNEDHSAEIDATLHLCREQARLDDMRQVVLPTSR